MPKFNEVFSKKIYPFFFSEYEGRYSACLDAAVIPYEKIFDAYYDKTYAEGGGYSWAALAELFIAEHLHQYSDELKDDSESGMFCLYSDNAEAIYIFLDTFHEYIKDELKFRDLMDRANFAKWC